MRNLFVCHTQAHLILSCGLALGRFKNDENHLILFRDFLLKDEMKGRLDKVFVKTLYLQSIYPQELNTFKEKLKNYPVNDRKMKELMQHPYDKVFTVCDTIYPEQKCMQIAYKCNKGVEFCWLEDGIIAYFQNTESHGGLDSTCVSRFVRKLYFKYLNGLGNFYSRDFEEFGGSIYNRTVYSLYPDSVREPYKSQRTVIGISDNEYLMGLKAIYASCSLPINEGDIILLMDKFQTYSNPDKVKETVGTFVRENLDANKRIYCKFHPRETESGDIFDGCVKLENTVGAESMYLSLSDKAKSITVVGIKSAGIMSAQKLGFKTISLFRSCGEENDELIKFFNSIGIELK